MTIEPNTAFAASPPRLPAEDLAWDMQQAGLELFQAAGYGQYEISAFAKPGLESRHNLNYWRYGDFLAIGAGAHGKITMPADNGVRRYAKHRHPRQYLKAVENNDWYAEQRDLGEQERVFEFFLNQLRLKHGVVIDDFEARTGLPWRHAESRVQTAIKKGLLEESDGRLKPTELGWRFVNDIQQIFLP